MVDANIASTISFLDILLRQKKQILVKIYNNTNL